MKNQTKGAASLITVIFISIVLTILVLGFIRLAISEQRQATDDDLTNRALYAAEAGIEDAKRAISSGVREITQCNGLWTGDGGDSYENVLSPPVEFDTEYTCLLIDTSPPNFESYIEKGKTKQIHLSANDSFDRITIDWHINAPQPDGDGAGVTTRSVSILPPESSWGNHPAMLRSYLFSYTNPITRENLNNSVDLAFLNPASSGASINATTPSPSRGVYSSGCNTNVGEGEYVCSQTYQVTSERNYVLRLTSLYKSAHIRVTLRDSITNSVINISGVQALIDSTGRASDVYRRVETRVDISGNSASLVPDFAIYSAEDICKTLEVGETTAAFKSNWTVAGDRCR